MCVMLCKKVFVCVWDMAVQKRRKTIHKEDNEKKRMRRGGRKGMEEMV